MKDLARKNNFILRRMKINLKPMTNLIHRFFYLYRKMTQVTNKHFNFAVAVIKDHT